MKTFGASDIAERVIEGYESDIIELGGKACSLWGAKRVLLRDWPIATRMIMMVGYSACKLRGQETRRERHSLEKMPRGVGFQPTHNDGY